MGEVWRTAIIESFNKFLGKVLIFLPNLLAMVTILIIGFLIAWAVKVLLLRFLKAIQFDRVSKQWGLSDVLSKGGVAYSPVSLLTRFFYWVIVLITLILGINALEVTATQKLITQFFNYLPNLFAAIIILVIGYLISMFLGQATLIAAVNAQMESAKILARAVRWFIIILSLTMALYQLGIAEKVIIAAFSIFFGGVVLALAVAFGWGGRDLAKDFLERLYKRREKRGEGEDHISHI
ncbi:MAG: mechanosensitive ion channel family protein [Thermodesulfobacteriota bacterium]